MMAADKLEVIISETTDGTAVQFQSLLSHFLAVLIFLPSHIIYKLRKKLKSDFRLYSELRAESYILA